MQRVYVVMSESNEHGRFLEAVVSDEDKARKIVLEFRRDSDSGYLIYSTKVNSCELIFIERWNEKVIIPQSLLKE